ncbi:MAG: hypothetical protein JXQ90_10810 [Cyclobacteriaceae bacterium]
MKRFIALFAAFAFMQYSIAQESADAIDNTIMEWSSEPKMVLAGVWGLIIVILVIRTFRNKPEI